MRYGSAWRSWPRRKGKSSPRENSSRGCTVSFWILRFLIQASEDFDSPAEYVSMTTAAYSSPRNTHSIAIGYLAWLFVFLEMPRFYYGKPVTGTICFFRGGFFLIGWIVDFFLIPSMDARADRHYWPGRL